MTIHFCAGGVSCNLPIVFKKAEQFAIQRNNLLGELPFIGKQFIISFQLFITASAVGELENIIHFTIGGDWQNLGDRTPVLWLTRGMRLYVGSAINRVPDYNMETSFSLSLNTWHDIEISQLMLGSEVPRKYKISIVTNQFYLRFSLI